MLSMSNFATTGASVPSGNCDSDGRDLVAHVLRAGVAVALEAEEDDDRRHALRSSSSVSSSMPSIVLIASSSGLVTLLSISSTLAPDSVVVVIGDDREVDVREADRPRAGGTRTSPSTHQKGDEHGGGDGAPDAEVDELHAISFDAADAEIRGELGTRTAVGRSRRTPRLRVLKR